jgi:ABC-type glycerol-3-phosphate transport system permease component
MAFQGTKINPKRFDKSQLKFYAFLIPMALFMVLPVVYIVNQAFKPLDELFMFPPRFFVLKPTLKNFIDLWRTSSTTGVPMTRYLFNSIVATTITVFAVDAGDGRRGLRLVQEEIQVEELAVQRQPDRLDVRSDRRRDSALSHHQTNGLTDNFLAHILPALAMPVGLFLVKQFMDQVPDAVIEAARLDGANDVQILIKIVIPLVKPALATVGILTFQASWNATEAPASTSPMKR